MRIPLANRSSATFTASSALLDKKGVSLKKQEA